MITFYEYATEFTNTYKKYKDGHIAVREAECLKVMDKYQFLPIEDGDLIAGRKRILELGFSNEPLLGRSVGFFYDEERLLQSADKEGLDESQKDEIRGIIDYFKTEETRYRIRQAFPEYMRKALPEDIYWNYSETAFPLYRIVGIYMDYDKLLGLGLDGLKAEVDEYKEKRLSVTNQSIDSTHTFYDAMEQAIDSLSEVCMAYAGMAEAKGKLELSEALRNIAHEAPCNFMEAMQLAWLYSLVSGVLNYGRMDDYLGGFLARDYERGILTEEKALSYVKSLWKLIADRVTVFHGRVIIGGRGRKDEAAADAFALLAIEASRTVIEIEPQLSLRFYKGQNPLLMERALDSIGEGRTYPMLYNDDVNIPAVMRAFGVSEEEAADYMMFGCGEYVINKKSIGSPNGIINLLKALEATLYNGHDMLYDKEMGIRTGEFAEFDTFEEFYQAYKKQVTYYIEILAEQEKLEYDIMARTGCFLYMSALFGNCLERGKGMLEGGTDYLGGTLETYGNVNTINSLYAIKRAVFEEKSVSKGKLLDILKADFKGYELVRRQLMDIDKYGNDINGIDAFASDFHDFICDTIKNQSQKERVKLSSYLAVIINNEANTILGRFTGASADGRMAGEPMANANNPTGGTDRNGITAMINSLVRLDTGRHAGAVQNMAFSRTFFNENRDRLKAVLNTYFYNGGQQAMITVRNREDLENAIKYPERYKNLMVRVGGFSARFVTLSRDVQGEILSRTFY